MRLWIYSVSCCVFSSAALDVPHLCKQDEMLLWCVDEELQTHVVQVGKYKSHISILPKRRDICKMGPHNIKPSHFPAHIRHCIHHIDVWENARVMMSYTKSKHKPVIRVFLNNESTRRDVERAIQKAGKHISCVSVKEILDRSMSAEVQFLYCADLHYQAWFDITDSRIAQDTGDVIQRGITHHVADVDKFVYQKETATSNAPFLRKLFVRVFAHASTATKANQFDPSEDIPEDEIRYIAYVVARKEVEHCNVLDYTQYSTGERGLLEAFGHIVASSNIHVIVYASDEHTKPNCLFYLQRRALRHGVNLHFSKLPTFNEKCEIKQCENGVSSYLDFTHKGTERLDLCCVLQKAMVNPPLDGFTLLDALRHEKLIRDKTVFDKLLQLNYHGLHSFSSHTTIRTDLALFVRLLWTLEHDNDFLVSQQNVSHICDTDITSVSERGQQKRVRNLFCRRLHKRKIVINTEKTKESYIIVKKPQSESDFPNPEWLTNPPVANLRGTELPRHVLHEPLARHLLEIVNLPHNNVFDIPKPQETEVKEETKETVAHGPPLEESEFTAKALHKRSVLEDDTLFTHNASTKRTCMQKEQIDDSHIVERDLKRPFEDLPKSNKKQKSCAVEKEEGQEDTQALSAEEDDNVPEEEEISPSNEQEITQPPEIQRKPSWWSGKRKEDFEKKTTSHPSKRQKKAPVVRYSGGLVLDAETGFYIKDEDSAVTWDFAGLYPSIMQGFQICYMRVIYKRKWLDDPRLEKQYIPITETECVVYAKSYDGEPVESILPEIVRDIVELRANTRKLQKNYEKGTFQWSALEGQQLAAKVVSNSVYGFTGSQTSGMTCTAIAAAITNIGRWMNRTVRFVILFLGGWIYYGDTDSVMARFWIPPHCTTPDEIYQALYEKGFLVQKFATGLFPQPNKLEFEAVKRKFLLLGKKVYAAIEMAGEPEAWKKPLAQKPKIMGVAAKKRDKCDHAQRIGMTLIRRLLYTDDTD